VSQRSLYFHANGGLSFTAPTDTAPRFDSYVSDPAHPVPYRARPIQATYDPRGSGWRTWLTEDQRFVDGRPDVLTFVTEPLTADIAIAGDIIANIVASTTGSDADWIVKLIDVYPETMPEARMGGYQLMVSSEVFRGRYRTSFEKPERIVPNQTTSFRYSLNGQNYTFRRGHKIMVQVQSTWFPLIDRNPQTFVPNIFAAQASDYRAATVRVMRSARAASHLVLPVVSPTGAQ
jgi:putative CocE/NonD family hydrolase